jgi:hypothetical protein
MKDFPEKLTFPPRSPREVMRLKRMGASFPTRLSFLPTLLRRLRDEQAKVTRPVWNMDADGFGHAVYSVDLGGHTYSLVAVSTDLPDDMRTDRVIATAWDTAYVLYDGVPDAAEIERICTAAPKQEAARFTERDLVLSRANKSVRLFAHVIEALKSGQQPDAGLIGQVGYLMRTTAVYGNGKFGIADRGRIMERPGLSGPFMAEMLTVWLIRGFTHDLVEYVGGGTLDPKLKRHLGIGNSTGLGMAPFLVSHPLLLDAWMQVRETALARVRGVEYLDHTQIARLYTLAERVAEHLSEWNVPDPDAQSAIQTLRHEWPQLVGLMTPEAMADAYPINALVEASQQGSLDLQELVASFVIEPFGDLVDGLTDCMATPFEPRLDPAMDLTEVQSLIARDWDWAVARDYNDRKNCAQFWYVSEEKLEPRLGNRFEEEGADLESPLDVARSVKALDAALDGASGTVAAFLKLHPEHRFALRRVQALAHHPYAEIRDNLIADTCRPIDMLRCKLSYFGAAKFDPKSDRWTRITLAQGAPLWDELHRADDWWLPSFGMS